LTHQWGEISTELCKHTKNSVAEGFSREITDRSMAKTTTIIKEDVNNGNGEGERRREQ